jgi:hypothetical protein
VHQGDFQALVDKKATLEKGGREDTDFLRVDGEMYRRIT